MTYFETFKEQFMQPTHQKKMINLKQINIIAEYFFILIAVYIILFTDYNYLLVLPLFPIFALIRLVRHYGNINSYAIPEYHYTLGLTALYMTIFGEFFFEFYYRWAYYDKLLHLLVPVYLTLVINSFFGKNLRFRTLLIFLAVMGIGAIWEIFEFSVDSLSSTTLMQGVFIDMKELTGGIEDTMVDMMVNLIGAIVGAIFLPRSSKHTRGIKKWNIQHLGTPRGGGKFSS